MLLRQEIALSVFTFFHYDVTYGFHYTSALTTMTRDQGSAKNVTQITFLLPKASSCKLG